MSVVSFARGMVLTLVRVCRESMAIIDANDIVVACLLASPKDDMRVPWERFEACGPRLAALIHEQVTQRPQAWTKGLGSKRGDFCSLTVGINYNFTKKVADCFHSGLRLVSHYS